MNSSPSGTSQHSKNHKHKKSHIYIRQVRNLFQRMDAGVAAFRKKSSMSCLEGCGHCCWNPKVETTVLEMLPLAESLIESGQAGHWYEKTKAADFSGVCVFYDHQPDNTDKGRCGIYEHRPSICRLYGFSGMVNKRGGINLMTCSVIKQKDSEYVRAAQTKINQGLKVPVMKEFSAKLYQVDPVLGHQRWPINKATALAIERLSLQRKYRDLEKNSQMDGKEVSNMANSQKKQDKKEDHSGCCGGHGHHHMPQQSAKQQTAQAQATKNQKTNKSTGCC